MEHGALYFSTCEVVVNQQISPTDALYVIRGNVCESVKIRPIRVIRVLFELNLKNMEN
jgi:hypothetical protein